MLNLDGQSRAAEAANTGAVDTVDEADVDGSEDLARPRGGGGGGGDASVGVFTETAPATSGRIPRRPTSELGTVDPFEFPELVELERRWSKTPDVVKAFRKVGKVGEHRAGVIRLTADLFKKGNEIQLARTLAHEIGHLVDWLPSRTMKRGNLIGRLRSLQAFMKGRFTTPDGTRLKNADIKAELVALSAEWRPWDRDGADERFRQYRDSSRELYADALSVLMNDPGRLEATAPTFYREFFAGLDEKPGVQRAYFDLQEVLSGTRDELVERRRTGVRRMFEEGDVTARELERRRLEGLRQQGKDLWFRLKHQLVDKNYAVIDRVRRLERQGTRIPDDLNPIYMLEERNYLGGKLKGFIAQHFDPLYRALGDTDIHWNAFGEALLYERIIAGDRSDVANPRGLSAATAAELYTSLQRELGAEKTRVLTQQIGAFRAAVREIAEDAYRAGLYTDDLHARMAANPAYVTFQVIDHLERGVTSRVYKQIGTLKDIVNPADATILKTLVTLRAIEHNRAKQSVFELFETHFPDDVADAATVWSGRTRRPVESRDPTQTLVTYYRHGTLVGKYVDPYIADAVENASLGRNLAVISVLRRVNSGLFRPVFTTFNLGFQLFNVARDFWRFWKNLPHITLRRAVRRYWEAVPLAKVRAYGLAAKPSATALQAWDDLIAAERAGIFSMTFNDLMAGRELEDTQMEDILARHGVAGFHTPKRAAFAKPFLAVLDVIKETGDFIETVPKAAAIIEFTGDGAISDISAEQRSVIRRKVGSPDFLAGGTLKPVSNEVFLFSNAITQAWRSDLEVATEPTTRAGFWWKTAAVNLVPKILLAAAMGGLAGEALRRMVERMTEYDRTNYIPVPLGEDTRGNVVYFRLPQDDSGRVVGGVVWKLLRALRGDAEVADTLAQVLDYSAGQFPSIAPSVTAVQATGQMVAGQNPRDAFRSRNVLTDDEQLARMEAVSWVGVPATRGRDRLEVLSRRSTATPADAWPAHPRAAGALQHRRPVHPHHQLRGDRDAACDSRQD